MNLLPPLFARVRIHRRGRRSLHLWVPLFLLWLLVLLLTPVLLLALLVTALVAPRWSFLPLARGAYVALCESRGATVALEGARADLFISLH